MYSKPIHIILITVLSIFLTSACSKLPGNPFGEKPPKYVNVQKVDFEEQCLSDSLGVMKRFMSGEATDSEIISTWDCFSNAILIFQKRVKGSENKAFAAREIATFFEYYFLNGIKINDRLLTEIMHLKQIIVGGSEFKMTYDELSRLVLFSNKMKQISLYLLPQMKILTANWDLSQLDDDVQSNIEKFEQANKVIQAAAKELSQVISENERSYKIENFVVLLEEMQSLYHSNWSWLKTLKDFLPIVFDLKSILTGGEPKSIDSQEWDQFLRLVSRGYVQYLRYNYFITKIESFNVKVNYIDSSLEDLFNYLNVMIAEKPSKQLARWEISKLFLTIHTIYDNFYYSEELITQIMKLKNLLIGGSLEGFELKDFTSASQKIPKLHNILNAFSKHSDFLFFKFSTEGISDEEIKKEFNSSTSAMQVIFQNISELVENDYDLQDLKSLLKELKPFLKSSNSKVWNNISNYGSLVVSIKEIILFDESSVIRKEEWRKLFNQLQKFYTQALDFKYIVYPHSLSEGHGLDGFNSWTQDTLEIIIRWLNEPHQLDIHYVSYAKLDSLANSLIEAKILPEGVQPQTVSKLVRDLLGSILLKPELRLKTANYQLKGFGLEAIDVIMDEFDLWFSNQKGLEKIFADNGYIINYFSLDKKLSITDLLKALKAQPSNPGLRELGRVFDTSIPLLLDSDDHFFISKEHQYYDFKSVTGVNLSRTLARVLIRGYSANYNSLINLEGLTKDEFEMFYFQIKGLLAELEILDPSNLKFASNRFLESNLFTPSADGDDVMSFQEGTQLLIMIYSGVDIASRLEKELESQCTIIQEKVKYNDKVNVDCALQVYVNHFDKYFTSLPHAVEFKHEIDSSKYTEMTRNLLKATGWVPNKENLASFGDLSLLPHIFQYLEVVMGRYDLNSDQVVDGQEALKAFPNFYQVIQKVSMTPSKILNQSIFLYLVKFGAVPPEDTQLKEILRMSRDWLKYEIHQRPLDISSDRFKFSKIFGAIADAVNVNSDSN